MTTENSKLKIAFFDAKSYDRKMFDEINKQFGFDIHYYKERLSINSMSLAHDSLAVCIFVNAECDRTVLQQLSQYGVKVVALRCAGFNNVDLKAARELGIRVVRVPAYSPHAIAEYAMALMLCLNRKIYRSVSRTREGNFKLNGLLGFDMYGKTVGVIGLGRIARVLVQILHGFGMHILAYDIHPDAEFVAKYGVETVSLDELYSRSDIISLHCPLTPETQYIINSQSISKMKKGVMIINTGRGKLIKSEDLIEGLRSGQIGCAGLDVYEEEANYFYEDRSDKLIDDDKLALLLMMPNVIITSHQAFFTKEATSAIAQTTLQNIQDYINGVELKNEVK